MVAGELRCSIHSSPELRWQRPAPVDDGDGVLAHESNTAELEKDAQRENKEKESSGRAR